MFADWYWVPPYPRSNKIKTLAANPAKVLSRKDLYVKS
jgi:hypothetical protein